MFTSHLTGRHRREILPRRPYFISTTFDAFSLPIVVMPHPSSRRLRPPAALLLAASFFLLTACAGAPAGTPGPGDGGYPYNVAGSYVGRFVFQGQNFDASIQLRTESGGAVRGAFLVSVPVTIEGRVEGVVFDDLLRLSVTYRGADGCDGTIEGILDVQRGGGVVEGPVTVRDCGPPVAGSMSFRRRERGTASRGIRPLPGVLRAGPSDTAPR